jgi:hypothetical protein
MMMIAPLRRGFHGSEEKITRSGFRPRPLQLRFSYKQATYVLYSGPIFNQTLHLIAAGEES